MNYFMYLATVENCALIFLSCFICILQFYRPTPEELMDIEQLFATADMNLALEASQSTFPFLRELAIFISEGGQFPQPPGKDNDFFII